LAKAMLFMLRIMLFSFFRWCFLVWIKKQIKAGRMIFCNRQISNPKKAQSANDDKIYKLP
jgi:hypothetical protein